jgi:glycolate oxidase
VSDELDELRDAAAGARLITDTGQMESYRRDQTPVVTPGQPRAVLLASSTEDVAAALAWAQQYRVPVVPRGGGTSLAGGATAIDGCLMLSTARMASIRELDPANEIAVAEAGVFNADLDRAAAEHGLMYAPDPSSYEIATLGGNLATNAGGLRCVKYGVTRDSVLGLEVVLAGGRVLQTGRRTMKGVTGYDLTGLFVGSEGTLGVITSATLRLRPRPASYPVTVAAGFASFAAAAEAVTAILAARIGPSLLELMDSATLRAIDEWKSTGFGNEVQALLIAQDDSGSADRGAAQMRDLCLAAGASMAEVSASEAESRQLLDLRRLSYPAIERKGVTLVEDVCVPRTRLPEMVARIETAAARHGVYVFERGLPEVPPQIWSAADEIFRAALELGGTLTGEHGIGMIKRRWMGDELGPESMAVHHAIKNALDPDGIMNPGKVL